MLYLIETLLNFEGKKELSGLDENLSRYGIFNSQKCTKNQRYAVSY